MPASVSILSTPIGSFPSLVPNTASRGDERSCIATVISVICKAGPLCVRSGGSALRRRREHLCHRDPVKLGLDRRAGTAVDVREMALNGLPDVAAWVDLVQAEQSIV